MNKNLMRRFNGSMAALKSYCSSNKLSELDLNDAYDKADQRFVYGGKPVVRYQRPAQPKFHKLGC